MRWTLRGGIYVPAEPDTDLRIYIDAGGGASFARTWGALLVFGDAEDAWLAEAVAQIRRRNAAGAEPSGEVKGGRLSDDEVASALKLLRGHDIYFYRQVYPAADADAMREARRAFLRFLGSLEADPQREDRPAVQARIDDLRSYVDALRPINQHKLLTLILFPQWLITLMGQDGLGPQLRDVVIKVDQENFPAPAHCSWCYKVWFASFLQAIGMSKGLTGGALDEDALGGAVRVDVACDSSATPGIEYVDYLIQGAHRGLPGFETGHRAQSRR